MDWQEAAILDSQNAEVWGMTCNVCLLQAQVVKPGEIYQPKADEVAVPILPSIGFFWMQCLCFACDFCLVFAMGESIALTFKLVCCELKRKVQLADVGILNPQAVAALKKALMYGLSTNESFPTQSSILEQVCQPPNLKRSIPLTPKPASHSRHPPRVHCGLVFKSRDARPRACFRLFCRWP